MVLLFGAGTAVGAQLITGKDIKDGSVTTKDIKNNNLTTKDIKDGSLTPAAIIVATSTSTRPRSWPAVKPRRVKADDS